MTNAERVKYFFPFWIDMAVPVFMIISGYTYAESYRKNNIVCISEAYKPEFLINKIIRYTCPFVIAYVLEIFIHIFLKDAISIKSILATFLVGGEGPGSYYYPIMIQFIFVYPVIYFIIKKFKYNGVILCGILNFIYELLKSAYGVSLSTYRLLIFRYVLIIAVGCYTTMEKKHLSVKKSVLYTICGMSFLILYSRRISVLLGRKTSYEINGISDSWMDKMCREALGKKVLQEQQVEILGCICVE